jgi:hypothetical protein
MKIGVVPAVLTMLLTFAPLAIQAAPRTIRLAVNGSNGKRMTVRVPTARAKELEATVKRLSRVNMPGYVSIYSGEFIGQGATPIIGKPRTKRQTATWLSLIKDTVGFGSDERPARKHGTGRIRVGDKEWEYDEIHEGIGGRSVQPQVYGTEASVPVTPIERAALTAFYSARVKGLLKDRRGRTIRPDFDGLSGTKREECTGACTSAFSAAWINAFERNIPTLASRGGDAFAGLGPQHVAALRNLRERTSVNGSDMRTNSSWIAIVRAFRQARLVSVGLKDPTNLVWQKQWRTQAAPRVIPDLAPGKSSTAYSSARISFADFLQLLPSDL